MCIFSRPVQHVANTRIFARLASNESQFLVYQMNYGASSDLAMILPLPVQTPALENSVRFINLQKYPAFFRDVEGPFRLPGSPDGGTRGGTLSRVKDDAPRPLPVYDVGSFSASFVPTIHDFGRLDEQFVLPPQVWANIRTYRDFGFAVFKLSADPNRIQSPSHPMAFAFRTRYNNRLFLPTLHIHDGKVHPTETFDHALYYQDARLDATQKDRRHCSGQAAARFMNVPAAQNIIDGNLPCFKREIKGTQANRDLYVYLT